MNTTPTFTMHPQQTICDERARAMLKYKDDLEEAVNIAEAKYAAEGEMHSILMAGDYVTLNVVPTLLADLNTKLQCVRRNCVDCQATPVNCLP